MSTSNKISIVVHISILCAALAFHAGASAQSLAPSAQTSQQPDERDPVVERVFAEIGFSLGTLAVPTITGIALGAAAQGPCDGFLCGLGGPSIGGTLGLGLGIALMPAMVSLAGELVDGEGSVGAAYLGLLGGAAVGGGIVGLAFATTNDSHVDIRIAAVLTGCVLTVAGPIVGYELSHTSSRNHRRAQQPTVMPTASFDGQTGTVGVVGQF